MILFQKALKIESIEKLKATIRVKRTKLTNKNLLVSQSSDDANNIVECESKMDESKNKKENFQKKAKHSELSLIFYRLGTY